MPVESMRKVHSTTSMRRDPRKQTRRTLEVAQVMREFHHVFSRHLTGVQGSWNVDDLPIGDSAQDIQRRGEELRRMSRNSVAMNTEASR